MITTVVTAQSREGYLLGALVISFALIFHFGHISINAIAITMRYELLSKNDICRHWTAGPICSYHLVQMMLIRIDEYICC